MILEHFWPKNQQIQMKKFKALARSTQVVEILTRV